MQVRGKKFLVTGGAGFIGSHIIEELLKQNKEVVCIDNMVTGKVENVLDFCFDRNFHLVIADITKLEDILPWFRDVDVVFHNAASKCTVCRDNPQLDLDVNTRGAWNVFEASRLNGVKKVIHASTGSVYGEAIKEQDENHPFKPVSFYGVSKLAGERYLEAFRQYYGLDYSIIRYFHVFGSRQDASDKGGVIPIFIRKALRGEPITIFGDGHQVRHFTYVKDDVNANFILANSSKSGEAYNVANNGRTTILELAEKIIDITESNSVIVHEEPRKGDIKWFDVKTDKIGELGMDYRIFESALVETINHYKEVLCDTQLSA